jgi:hypothetical protein
MIGPTNKVELLSRIRSAYNHLENALSLVPPSRLTVTGVTQEWSVKDLTAHIHYWQDFLFSQIQAVLDNTVVMQQPLESQADTDRINRQVVLASRDKPWAVVHLEFQQSTQRVLEIIESLSDVDLFTRGRFLAIDHEPLWVSIASETYEHYEEHLEHIRRIS